MIAMNDDIYQRKDIADEREKYTFEMIAAVNRRIDDIQNNLSHVLAVVGVCFAVLALGLSVLIYFLQ